MRLNRAALLAPLAVPLIVGLSIPGAAVATEAGGTPPAPSATGGAGDAEGIAIDHLRGDPAEYGVGGADLADLQVASSYTSEHNGVTHVNLTQRYRGLEVFGAQATVNVLADGSILHVGQTLVDGLAAKASGSAETDAVEAVEAAAEALELDEPEGLATVRRAAGAARETTLSGGNISDSPITARQGWQPTDDGLRLAWQLVIDDSTDVHLWNATVDAATGELLAAEDWTSHDDHDGLASGLAREGSAALADTHGSPSPVDEGSSYRVYELPKESPNDGGRTVVTNPADGLASPFGWHDTNGALGAEFTTTRGNNVHAYLDRNNSNTPAPGPDVDGGPSLTFDFPLDLTQSPLTYGAAATTNLFYMNNVTHDVMYRYGFTEAAGNFQANNYGRGGTQGDYVRAEAQDGGGVNNANFSTPALDGGTPRMQMYLWNPSGNVLPNQVVVDPPSSAAGTYGATGAAFGPALGTTGLSGQFVVANDGSALPTEACAPLIGFPAGAVAIVDRGTCPFVDKVLNAQNAGASAVIVGNNVAGAPITMGGANPAVVIPSVMVSLADANTIRAGLPATGTLRANPAAVQRDGDLDNGIVIHEYGHGVSLRLTGGPTINCLSNAEQMGEGWSDYLAIAMLMDPALDDPEGRRGMGTYAVFEDDRTGAGIRPRPYSRNLAINPFTYDNIRTGGWLGGTLAQPHGVGWGWATVLWDMTWDLVDKHGFHPNVYGDWDEGGNNLAIQLVIDGLKIQGCSPGFVNGRDAIIAADAALTGGENHCTLWSSFARRGLGASAVQGSSNNRNDNTQAFDLPADCRAQADVDPDSLSVALVEGDSTTEELTVSNLARPDGEDLEWTITEAATDCSAPSDLGWVSADPTAGTTAAAGSSTVTVTFDATGLTAPDVETGLLCLSSNDAASPLAVPLTLQVQYPFGGFLPPVADAPELNQVNAGSSVPVRFSLGGDRGLDILAAGSPSSQQVDCTTLAPIGASTPIVGPGGSQLTYDSATDEYNRVWRTERSWAGSCRALTVELDDGSTHVAYFRFV